MGVLIYIIARSDKMKAHEVSRDRMQAIAFISELGDLKDRGILTNEEFQRAKRKSQPLTGAAPSPDDDVAELQALRARGKQPSLSGQRDVDLSRLRLSANRARTR